MVTVLEDDASDGEGSEHGRGKAKRKQAKQQENNQDAHQGDGVDDPNAVGLAVASQLMVRRGPDPDLPWFISYPKVRTTGLSCKNIVASMRKALCSGGVGHLCVDEATRAWVMLWAWQLHQQMKSAGLLAAVDPSLQ